MTKYETRFSPEGTRIARIKDDGISTCEYFTGYDFMGSANWSTNGADASLMELDEAEQIAADLEDSEALDDQEEEKPATMNPKTYKRLLDIIDSKIKQEEALYYHYSCKPLPEDFLEEAKATRDTVIQALIDLRVTIVEEFKA